MKLGCCDAGLRLKLPPPQAEIRMEPCGAGLNLTLKTEMAGDAGLKTEMAGDASL